VIHPQGNRDIEVNRMLDDHGADIRVAPGSGHFVRIALDAALDRALLARYL
jgi:putative protease